MWSSKWLIVAFTIVSIASCASITKQDEVLVDIDEQPKPQEAEPPVTPKEPTQPSIVPDAIIPADSNLPPLQGPPRRVITYDQRQEGKYNIRADLENFMIVLIPSSQSAGTSFLDLLKRSAQQKSKIGSSKSHKKYHAPSESKNIDKPHSHQTDEAAKLQFLQHQAAAALAAEKARPNQPFIEGRTPYHVDISSSEPSAADLQKQQSPLYRMLLPLLQKNAEHVAQRRSADPENTHRASKSLSDANRPGADLINNSVVLAMGPLNREYFGSQHRGFGSDYVDPYSSYEFVSIPLEGDSNGGGADSIDRLAAGETSKSGWDEELKLLGATEQCGPDRRRDSYGICQFVPLD